MNKVVSISDVKSWARLLSDILPSKQFENFMREGPNRQLLAVILSYAFRRNESNDRSDLSHKAAKVIGRHAIAKS